MQKFIKLDLLIFILSLSLLILFSLILGDWNFSVFCNFGDKTDISKFPMKIIIFKDTLGYDGQYFCRMSIDPFDILKKSIGVEFESHSYRYSRIIYPLIAWLFSLNIPWIAILNLLLINIISIFLIYHFGKKYFKFNFLILFLPFIPFVISRNTAEILSIIFVLCSIINFKKKNIFCFSLFSILAILTRETSLIFYLISSLFYLFKNRLSFSINNLIIITPLIIFILWRVLLNLLFGEIPENIGIKVNFDFSGLSFFKSYISTLYRISEIKYFYHLIQLTFIFYFIIFVSTKIKFKNLDHVDISFFIYSLGYLLMAQHIFNSDFAFFRVFPEVFLLGFIILYKNDTLISKYISLPIIIMFVLNVLRICYNHYTHLFL